MPNYSTEDRQSAKIGQEALSKFMDKVNDRCQSAPNPKDYVTLAANLKLMNLFATKILAEITAQEQTKKPGFFSFGRSKKADLGVSSSIIDQAKKLQTEIGKFREKFADLEDDAQGTKHEALMLGVSKVINHFDRYVDKFVEKHALAVKIEQRQQILDAQQEQDKPRAKISI